MMKSTQTVRKSRFSLRLAGAFVLGLSLTGCFATAGSDLDITAVEPLKPENVARSGWEYFERGQYAAAIPSFRMAIAETPDDENLRYGLAESYRRAGYMKDAESQYAQLLTSESFRIAALCGIGHVKLATQDTSGAFEMFSTAVAEDDAASSAWLGLAQLRDLAKDWEAADTAYAKALESTQNRSLVLNNAGVSMLARGDAKTALVYFQMAASADPESERIQTNIDFARSALKDRDAIKELAHLDPKTQAKKLNNLGYAAMLRGDAALAQTYLQEAIEIHPSFYAIAHKNLQTLESAQVKAN